jgi:DNA end-binding protein Ku
MRAIWSGSLSFGLVNIPVKLYSAIQEKELKFHLLHEKDFSPIRYARVCRANGEEVPYEEVVKGYEYKKGDFVVLEDEDFEKASPKKTKTIDIHEFVAEKEIDPIYFDKPYYLEPDKESEKAYMLLREALEISKKVAIASYVLRNREHIGIVKPYDKVIVLNQMRYAEEIQKPDKLELPESKAKGKEVDMALKLIDQLSEKFKPETFHDTYVKEMKAVIESKAKGQTIKVKEGAPEPTRVPDIMQLLRASLERKPGEKVKSSKGKR